MNLLYPRIPLARLPSMLRLAGVGALVAGAYGALHDQVSYTISPEYFTKLKFEQFAWADLGGPRRLFVAEVGFLATWWVGMIAGWVLARVGRVDPSSPSSRPVVVRAFGIILGVAVISGCVGVALGVATTRGGDVSGWREWKESLDLADVRGFAIVAWLHWASYLGGLLGLVLAVTWARRQGT